MTSKNTRERLVSRRETMGKYSLDLSKLSFSGLFLGGIVAYVTNNIGTAAVVIAIGAVMTVALMAIGYKLLN